MAIINNVKCWADIRLVLFGVVVTLITEVNYKRTQKKENGYGVGDEPTARLRGNKEYEGSITVYGDVVDQLIAAAPNRDLFSIAPFQIIVVYGNPANPTIDVLKDCEFMETEISTKQGDTSIMVKLPLVIGGITFNR